MLSMPQPLLLKKAFFLAAASPLSAASQLSTSLADTLEGDEKTGARIIASALVRLFVKLLRMPDKKARSSCSKLKKPETMATMP